MLAIPPSKRIAAPSSAFDTSTPARPRATHPFADEVLEITEIHEMDATSSFTYPARHPHAPSLKPPSPEDQARELHLEAMDEDYIAGARALIDAKEFSRAVHWLKDCKSAKAVFMFVYSQYMVSSLGRFPFQTFDDR